MMTSIVTKWGSIIVFILVIGMVGLATINTASGVSTWLTDNYLPKKYMIAEKYPVRIIVYGQFKDIEDSKIQDKKDAFFLELITALAAVPDKNGSFGNNYSIDFDSDFNTKQIRSTARSNPMAPDKDKKRERGNTPQYRP